MIELSCYDVQCPHCGHEGFQEAVYNPITLEPIESVCECSECDFCFKMTPPSITTVNGSDCEVVKIINS